MQKTEPAPRRDTFANRHEGRIRRDTRKAAIAAKRVWLDLA
jgi:hypothetical protein